MESLKTLTTYKVIDGFKFGLMLQIAVGPVCFFIFQMAVSNGLISALVGTLGVTIIDGLYIFFAILGIGKLLEKNKNIKNILKYFGSFVLIVFGLYIVLNSSNSHSVSQFNITKSINQTPFLSAILLTLSNPLTIVFWSGVFASKTAEDNMDFKEVTLFGIGSLIATLIFLSLVSVFGCFTKSFVNEHLIMLLNIAVGFVLIFFGIKPYFKKHKLFILKKLLALKHNR